MDNYQDWKPIYFNKTNSVNNENKEKQKKISQKIQNTEKYKLVLPKNFGNDLAKARTTKGFNRKQFANNLNMTEQIISLYETNKEVPNNATIAKMEKFLGIKLPRAEKVLIED